MELADLIKKAWAAVEESGVPEQMQELAFRESLRVLLETVPATGPRRPLGDRKPTDDGSRVSESSAEVGGQAVSEAEMFERISAETTVPVQRLELLFHVDDGVVKLIGPVAKYGKNTATQARNIAQIVTVVRKLGLDEADTSFEVLKEACMNKHCYDSSNFASQHMKVLPSGFVTKGDGKNRRLEAKGPAITAFPVLVDSVLGEA